MHYTAHGSLGSGLTKQEFGRQGPSLLLRLATGMTGRMPVFPLAIFNLSSICIYSKHARMISHVHMLLHGDMLPASQ